MKMRTWFKPCALTLGTTIALALSATAVAQNQQPVKFKVAPAQLQALNIQVVTLAEESRGSKRSFPGQVVAPAGADQVVSSAVAGVISQIMVEQFQTVRAGTPLLKIASAELGQLQLQAVQAASKLSLAQQNFKREQDLLSEGIVAQRRVQESQANLREAQAALAYARAALRLAGMGDSAIERVISSGRPEDGISIVAARAGTVSQLLAKPGQRVESSTSLLHITQPGALALEIQLPAAEAAAWPVGARVEVPATGATGRIVGASPQIAPGSQTTSLRATIDDKAATLRPGQLVSVEIEGGKDGGFDVPLAAVAHDGDQAVVFVRTAEGFEARPVTVTQGSGQRTHVTGSLKPGEQIAVSGIVALKGAWQAAKGAK